MGSAGNLWVNVIFILFHSIPGEKVRQRKRGRKMFVCWSRIQINLSQPGNPRQTLTLKVMTFRKSCWESLGLDQISIWLLCFIHQIQPCSGSGCSSRIPLQLLISTSPAELNYSSLWKEMTLVCFAWIWCIYLKISRLSLVWGELERYGTFESIEISPLFNLGVW